MLNINFNVDLQKIKLKEQQKAKTGMSMQNTVNNALNLPMNNGQTLQTPSKNEGWGSNVQ